MKTVMLQTQQQTFGITSIDTQQLKFSQFNAIQLEPGTEYRIIGEDGTLLDNVIAEQIGADLSLLYSDGTAVYFKDYFLPAEQGGVEGAEVYLPFEDGEIVIPQDGTISKMTNSDVIYMHGDEPTLAGMSPEDTHRASGDISVANLVPFSSAPNTGGRGASGGGSGASDSSQSSPGLAPDRPGNGDHDHDKPEPKPPGIPPGELPGKPEDGFVGIDPIDVGKPQDDYVGIPRDELDTGKPTDDFIGIDPIGGKPKDGFIGIDPIDVGKPTDMPAVIPIGGKPTDPYVGIPRDELPGNPIKDPYVGIPPGELPGKPTDGFIGIDPIDIGKPVDMPSIGPINGKPTDDYIGIPRDELPGKPEDGFVGIDPIDIGKPQDDYIGIPRDELPGKPEDGFVGIDPIDVGKPQDDFVGIDPIDVGKPTDDYVGIPRDEEGKPSDGFVGIDPINVGKPQDDYVGIPPGEDGKPTDPYVGIPRDELPGKPGDGFIGIDPIDVGKPTDMPSIPPGEDGKPTDGYIGIDPIDVGKPQDDYLGIPRDEEGKPEDGFIGIDPIGGKPEDGFIGIPPGEEGKPTDPYVGIPRDEEGKPTDGFIGIDPIDVGKPQDDFIGIDPIGGKPTDDYIGIPRDELPGKPDDGFIGIDPIGGKPTDDYVGIPRDEEGKPSDPYVGIPRDEEGKPEDPYVGIPRDELPGDPQDPGPVNLAPDTTSDRADVVYGETYQSDFSVLDNDSDPEGDSLTVIAGTFTTFYGGTVTFNEDGTFVYVAPTEATPGNDDWVSYEASDGTNTTDGWLNFDLTEPTPVNNAPVTTSDFITVESGELYTSSVSVLANDSDPDGDNLSVIAGTFDTVNGSITFDSDGNYTYTPRAGFVGTDWFTYTATDGTDSTAGGLTITVTEPANTAPIAVDDFVRVRADEAYTSSVSVLANDTDPDGDTLSVIAGTFNTANRGSVTIDSDGNYIYTPPAGFTGTDSFGYKATDGINISTGRVRVEVNNAPEANIDFVDVNYGEAYTSNISVLANDTDADGDTLSVIPGSFATMYGGWVTIGSDGNYEYTPPVGFAGSDWFNYTATDGIDSSTSQVILTVAEPANNAPIARDDFAFATEGEIYTSVNSLLKNDIDPNGDTLTVTSGTFTTAQGGTITITEDGNYTYVPKAGFSGPDTFEYIVSDGSLIDRGLLKISVQVANYEPDPVDDFITVSENTEFASNISVLANDFDFEGDELSVTTGTFTTVKGGIISITADGHYVYTPPTDFTGDDFVNYTVSDGQLSNTATLFITVELPNIAPIANDDSVIAVEDTQLLSPVSLLDNDTDRNGDDLYVIDGTFATVQGGTIVITLDGNYTYTPPQGFYGQDSYEYALSDGYFTTYGTLNIDVQAINTAPDAGPDHFSANYGETYQPDWSVLDNDSDADGDQLTVIAGTFTTAYGGIVIMAADGTFEYQAPDTAAEDGRDWVLYEVTDGQDITQEWLTFHLSEANNAPVVTDDSVELVAGAPYTSTVSVLANDSDPDGDTLRVWAGAIRTSWGGTVVFSEDGHYVYTSPPNFRGTDSVFYDVLDDQGGITRATLELNVIVDPNQAPEAVDDIGVLDAAFGDVIALDLLANDTDADGDPLTITHINQHAITGNEQTIIVARGSIYFDGQGGMLFKPDERFDVGEATYFEYTISDGRGGTSTATANGTIREPDLISDDTHVLDGMQRGWNTIDLLNNDSDTLTITHINNIQLTGGTQIIEVNNGSVMITSDGAVLFATTPDQQYEGVRVEFNYTVSDGNGNSDTATAGGWISLPHLPRPIAVDDIGVLTGKWLEHVDLDLLANDYDEDGGNDLTVTHINGVRFTAGVEHDIDVQGGRVVIFRDGSITFMRMEKGYAEFEYTITDSDGHTSTAIANGYVNRSNIEAEAQAATAPDTLPVIAEAQPEMVDISSLAVNPYEDSGPITLPALADVLDFSRGSNDLMDMVAKLPIPEEAQAVAQATNNEHQAYDVAMYDAVDLSGYDQNEVSDEPVSALG